jgi:tetratricopeptide (TPR) repeat protein
MSQEPIETPPRESRFMSRRRKSLPPNPGQSSLPNADPASNSLESNQTAANRFSVPQWGQGLAVLTCAIIGLLVLVGFLNRGSKRPSARVDQARRMLQINRPRLAIEALAKEESAEGHYLKAIALQSVGEAGAAREQIGDAIAIAPADPKYQGYDSVLKLTRGNTEVSDELIKTYELHPTSPGIAFFATRAFLHRQPPDSNAALQAFQQAVISIDQTPEFMFSALHFSVDSLQHTGTVIDKSVRDQLQTTAEGLLNQIEELAPQDIELLKELLTWAVQGKLVQSGKHLVQRITELQPDHPENTSLLVRVELMLGDPVAAMAAAQRALSEHPDDLALELLLADSVAQAPASPENEEILAGLLTKHPDNPEFLAKLTVYLTRSKRLPDAVALINRALITCKPGPQRDALLNLAIGVPLEAKHAGLAEQQLKRFNSEFQNPHLLDYLEGRVLFLKQDYAGAKKHFQKVISPLQIKSDADRRRASECLVWYQQVLKWELGKAQEQAALKRLKVPQKAASSAADKKPAGVSTPQSQQKNTIQPMAPTAGQPEK